jgi:hypothetical protein
MKSIIAAGLLLSFAATLATAGDADWIRLPGVEGDGPDKTDY